MSTATPNATRTAEPARLRSPRHTPTRTEKGMSLARGPALVLGTILTAVGLYLLYKAHTFPRFASFPDGTAHPDGKFLFGLFGANGWTGMLTAAGGGLLLFGAAQHFLAKTMSLIVGIALAAAAIIGLTSSGNVVGMAAANHLTELGWGVCAVILLFNTLVPRRTRTVEAVPVGGAYAGDEVAGRRRPLPPERARRDDPVAGDGVAGERGTGHPGAGDEAGRPGAHPGSEDATAVHDREGDVPAAHDEAPAQGDARAAHEAAGEGGAPPAHDGPAHEVPTEAQTRPVPPSASG